MDIIFYRPSLGSVSPGISVKWDGLVVDLLNRFIPMGSAVNFGGYAEEACADFIVVLAADPDATWGRTEIFNLRVRWDRFDPLCPSADGGADVPTWEKAFFAEIDRMYAGTTDPKYLPVLVSTDPPYHVTREGKLLCRMVNVLTEPWKDGEPIWIVPPGAGEKRRSRRRT